MSAEVNDFVRDALGRGLSRGQIEMALNEAGWPPEQVRRALSAFAEVDFPVPVPRPRPSLSAREAFIYLLLFATLYVSAYQLGSLVFQLINRAFPDAASGMHDQYYRDSIRFSAAALIVAFPVFLYMSRLTRSSQDRDGSKVGSPMRLWLTYLTLFMAASVLLGDVTTLVYNLLGGELTVRFVLKVLTVGIIAGSVFGYYLSELRTVERSAGG